MQGIDTMIKLFKNSSTFTKIEFWAITTVFVFVLFFFITDIFEWDDRAFADAPYKSSYDAVNMPFHFYRNYFFPQLARYIGLYLALLALNFIIIPGLLKKESLIVEVVDR